MAGLSDRVGRAGGLALILGLLGAPLASHAADLPYGTLVPVAPVLVREPFVSELRAGAYAHDFPGPERGRTDVNLEVIFSKPTLFADPFWQAFVPRPTLGGDINTGGRTNQFYFGGTWRTPEFYRVFGELEFGGEVNDGKAGNVIPRTFAHVGSNVMFHESLSIGYRLTDHWNILATVEHSSNANLANRNGGITNVGGRLGYQF